MTGTKMIGPIWSSLGINSSTANTPIIPKMCITRITVYLPGRFTRSPSRG
jgi:hypothetical protein